jgi:DNA-directed RNA polymerase specialized sigma24 family protein
MTDTNLGRDPAAFEAFYRRNVRSVSGFVARRLTDPQLVDDLTTEVFLAAIEGADSYRPSRGGESAWLLGIARNVLAAERRTAARRVDKMLRAGGGRWTPMTRYCGEHCALSWRSRQRPPLSRSG